MKGNTQVEPAAGPETAEQVPHENVVQTETPRESQTQTLQSCGKVEPGMQDVEVVDVVVVMGAAVVVVVVVTDVVESVGQVDGQKPYSPSM